MRVSFIKGLLELIIFIGTIGVVYWVGLLANDAINELRGKGHVSRWSTSYARQRAGLERKKIIRVESGPRDEYRKRCRELQRRIATDSNYRDRNR